MYSNLTLYYLNQIGIRPWIKRQDVTKLFIFVPSNLSSTANTLLKQMIKYIHLETKELLLIPVQDSGSLVDYQYQIDQKNPCAILAIGVITSPLNLKCSLVTCDSPEALLLHPAQKKKAFQALSYLNQLITA
jgi:hypothetical protein